MVTLLHAMMSRRKNSPAALRFAERRKRENDAPRLRDEVPGLVGLALTIEDRSGLTSTTHVRRVVVDCAPALFLVACADPRCAEGEHDLTSSVMQALRKRQTSFEGTDECQGSVGPSNCARIVHFDGVATYAETTSRDQRA
jgi:hypothetical protein